MFLRACIHELQFPCTCYQVVASEVAASKGGAYKLPPGVVWITHQARFPDFDRKMVMSMRAAMKYLPITLIVPLAPPRIVGLGEKILSNETLIQAIKVSVGSPMT